MNNIEILEKGIKKMIEDERIHDDYRNMLTAIENLIQENKELKEKNKELETIKENIKEITKKDRNCLTFGYHSAYVDLLDDLYKVLELLEESEK